MIETAAGYAPYAQVRRVSCWVTFRLVDTAAAGNATPSTSGAESISALAQLTDGVTEMSGPWATLEDDLWRLGEDIKLLPDDLTGLQLGWWSSAISAADKSFAANPTLTFALSATASSIGFMLYFDRAGGVWPAKVTATAYSGETQVATKTVDNAGPVCRIDMPSTDYDNVEFAFLETAEPYRRVRVCEVVFGIVQDFDAHNLVTASWQEGASIGCESIPTRELTFVFDNRSRLYNFLNPDGLYSYLQDGQIIESGLVIDGVKVDMGKHYFRKAEARDGAMTAAITANDRIYWLDGQTYDAGTSGTWTLAAAVAAVTTLPTSIPADIGARTVNRCIPVGTTVREALRLLAQAARCSCWIDRAGTLVFSDLAVGASVDTLTRDRMTSVDGITVGEKIDRVELSVDDCFSEFSNSTSTYASGTGSKVKTVANPCAYEGQAVADWLLACCNRRLNYAVPNRGNPAVEVGDSITIYNAYDAAGIAAVTAVKLSYDGGLTEETEATT